MKNTVFVHDTDINTNKTKTMLMYLKSHWSVNAQRPLSATLCRILTGNVEWIPRAQKKAEG